MEMENKTAWQKIDNLLSRVAKWFVYVAAASAGVMMAIAVIDVIGSKFFNRGILGTGEMIEELNIILVFMAVAYVQLDRGHIRIAIIENVLAPWANHILVMFGNLMGIFIFAFMSWRTLVLLKKHILIQVTKEGAIHFLLWPFSLAMFMGLVLLTIVYVAVFIKGLAGRS